MNPIKFAVWQSVLVFDQKHERANQAGTVQAVAREGDETVSVRFDVDGETVAVPVESVRSL